MPDFRRGQWVRRVGNSHKGVIKGNVYQINSVKPAGLQLKGITGLYGPGMFEPDSGAGRTKAVYLSPKPAPAGEEADPNGISANAPGAKLDAGKPLPRLVLGEFARALEAVARVGTIGARKYTPRGWLEVPNGEERYAEAALRHQLAVWKGQARDDGTGGTGEKHKAQVIWNLLAELELEERREANQT